MKVVVDINHPAHVHYFKNFIRIMEGRGHQVLITATEKDIACALLNHYGFEYRHLGSYGNSLFQKGLSLPLIDLRMLRAVRKFRPDVFLGFGSIRAAHVGYFLRKPCINFEDTEHSTEQIRLYLPFVSAICTPSCFPVDLGDKQVRFDGYMEMAALHPNYFTPDPHVLDEVKLSPHDRFIIVRFVSWKASHDIRQSGIQNKVKLVKRLEDYGRVIITSEGALPKDLEQYRINVSPEKLHDLLSFASLYVGEGATIASECAVLGTHAIYVNTLRSGCTDEEGERYDLISTFSDPSDIDNRVIKRAVELLSDPDLRTKGQEKRERLLNDKVDVTAFMVEVIEKYYRVS